MCGDSNWPETKCDKCGEHALECGCDLKPCINCEKLCPILPVQLGDFATLTYLRVCGGDCLFSLAYEFLYGLYEHKNFRNSLFDRENEEDRALRKKHQEQSRNSFLKEMGDHFKENPNILSHPAPTEILHMFKSSPPVPNSSVTTSRFTLFSAEDRKEWQRKYVEKQRKRLEIAEKDLEKIMNE